MNSGALVVLAAYVLLSGYHSTTVGAKCSGDGNTAHNPMARTLVDLPGTWYKPSTGNLLKILKLNNSILRGYFISHSGITVYFSSSSNGQARVWLEGGTNIMLHEQVSPQRDLYMLKLKDQSFVYSAGQAGLAYKLPEHRQSKKDVEYEYNQRSNPGNVPDEIHIRQALEELVADSNSRLVVNLSQALGEFGVYGHKSPCALPLYAMALSISHYLHQGGYKVSSNSDCHHDQTSSKRLRRGFWFWKKKTCTSLENDPNEESCLGMCGKNCSCWKFVCGDCCKHEGCLQHDKCCGAKGTFSIDCLFVIPFINFSCKRYKRYPECINGSDQDKKPTTDQREELERVKYCGNLTANHSGNELKNYSMSLTGNSLANISAICSGNGNATVTPTSLVNSTDDGFTDRTKDPNRDRTKGPPDHPPEHLSKKPPAEPNRNG